MHRLSFLVEQVFDSLRLVVEVEPGGESESDEDGEEDCEPDPAHGGSEQEVERPKFSSSMVLFVEFVVDVLQSAAGPRAGLRESFFDGRFEFGELYQRHERIALVLFGLGLEIDQFAIDGLSDAGGGHLADDGASFGVGVLDEPVVGIVRGGSLCGGVVGRTG